MFAPSVPLDIQLTNANFWCSATNRSNVNTLSTSFHSIHKKQESLNSVVSTVIWLQAEHVKNCGDTRINILQSTHTSSGAQMEDLSMETRQPRHEADQSPPSSAKVKKSMNRDNFIVTLHNKHTSCLHIAVAHTRSVAAPVRRKLVHIVAIKSQAWESYFNRALHEQNNTHLLSMPYKYNYYFSFRVVWWIDK